MAIGKTVGEKLSCRSFVGPEQIMAACLSKQDDEHFVGRFTGIASGLKPYQNAYKRDENDTDKLFGLVGVFQATGWDGTVKEGNVLYLPSNAHALVEAALTMGDVEGVKIAYDIYAVYNAKSATKYSFIVRDILQEENPTVAAIAEQIADIPLPTRGNFTAVEGPKAK